LPLGVYLKTGAAIIVPWAEADIIAAAAAQLNVASYEVDNVDSAAQLILGVKRHLAGHAWLRGIE
jgi:hypothetical protein